MRHIEDHVDLSKRDTLRMFYNVDHLVATGQKILPQRIISLHNERVLAVSRHNIYWRIKPSRRRLFQR